MILACLAGQGGGIAGALTRLADPRAMPFAQSKTVSAGVTYLRLVSRQKDPATAYVRNEKGGNPTSFPLFLFQFGHV